MATTVQLTIDCADPQAPAQFWTTALRYVPEPPPRCHEIWESWLAAMGVPESEWHDGASISDPEGKGPKLYFQRVPEPKTVKNHLHLDLDTSTWTSTSPPGLTPSPPGLTGFRRDGGRGCRLVIT